MTAKTVALLDTKREPVHLQTHDYEDIIVDEFLAYGPAGAEVVYLQAIDPNNCRESLCLVLAPDDTRHMVEIGLLVENARRAWEMER